MRIRRLSPIATVILLGATATAQTVPSSFNFQSKLYAPSGSAYTTPQGQTTDVTFKLYNSESGTSEIYKKKINIVINGGIVESTIDDQPGYPPINDLVKQNGTIFLGVQVGTDAELKPRMKLNSTPFAGHANYSSTAGVAEDVPLKNITPSSITINGVQVLDNVGNVNGASLKVNGTTIFDGSGQWVGPGELNGWQVVGSDVLASKTVKCALTCSMQHCEIRQLGGKPAAHFHNDSGGTGSFDARIVLENDDLLQVSGAHFQVMADLYAGKIGVGTTAPQQLLHVAGPGRFENTLEVPNLELRPFASNPSAPSLIDFALTATPTPDFDARLQLESVDRISLSGAEFVVYNGNVSATGFTTLSDGRYKSNLRSIDAPIERLSKLRSKFFDWTLDAKIADRSRTGVGFIAQDVCEALPEAVSRDATGALLVDYTRIIPLLTASLQEHIAKSSAEFVARDAERTEQLRRVDALELCLSELTRKNEENEAQAKRIEDLEAKLAALAERLAALEKH